MVFGSHAKGRAMYSIPPCPSLAASMAAYRRRSFSDSHPKNRCIFPSSSAVYSSIPSSWLQGLRRRQDTTAQASREVILHRILSRLELGSAWTRPETFSGSHRHAHSTAGRLESLGRSG